MPEELDDREENEYGNEQEYDNGRKRSPGLCQETDGTCRTADKHFIFRGTERAGSGICGYDGDDYDIRKMVRDLADAVRSSDEEKVNEILWDAREEIDGFPDRSVGMAELKRYGYTADDMFPLRQEMALELHRVGEKVYCLQSDGSHGDYASREMILEHEGLYGIEKRGMAAYAGAGG